MKRHYKPDLGNLYLHDVAPETAHWKYLSFKVAALAAGQRLEGNTERGGNCCGPSCRSRQNLI